MRIISPFVDYYDSVQYYGQDQTVQFIRSARNLEFNKDFEKYFLNSPKYPRRYGHYETMKRTLITFFKIGFCGQLYSGAKIYDTANTSFISNPSSEVIVGKEPMVVYSLSDYMREVNTRKHHYKQHYKSLFRDEFARNWFTTKQPEFEQFAIKNSFSIIVYESFSVDTKQNHSVIENASLKEFKFFKIKTPYEAFQELDMFISGVLGSKAPKTVTIEDKYKLVEHGFDDWSFKKRP